MCARRGGARWAHAGGVRGLRCGLAAVGLPAGALVPRCCCCIPPRCNGASAHPPSLPGRPLKPTYTPRLLACSGARLLGCPWRGVTRTLRAGSPHRRWGERARQRKSRSLQSCWRRAPAWPLSRPPSRGRRRQVGVGDVQCSGSVGLPELRRAKHRYQTRAWRSQLSKPVAALNSPGADAKCHALYGPLPGWPAELADADADATVEERRANRAALQSDAEAAGDAGSSSPGPCSPTQAAPLPAAASAEEEVPEARLTVSVCDGSAGGSAAQQKRGDGDGNAGSAAGPGAACASPSADSCASPAASASPPVSVAGAYEEESGDDCLGALD